jgi:hypothetical protein
MKCEVPDLRDKKYNIGTCICVLQVRDQDPRPKIREI